MYYSSEHTGEKSLWYQIMQRFLRQGQSMIHRKKVINQTLSKLRMCILQKSLIRERREQPQITNLTKDMHTECIKNSVNLMRREKKGQIFEKTLHQRRNKLVKKVIDYSLEKYKLKHSEIPPHIRIQNKTYQNKTMLARLWNNQDSSSPLIGTCSNATTLGKTWA